MAEDPPFVRKTWMRERICVSHDEEPELTKQSFAKECDINEIMRRYEKNGMLPHFNPRMPLYGNFESSGDFREALDAVRAAEAAFAALPARLRARVDNDPAKYIEFALDPGNRDELREFGLLEVAPEAAEPPKEAKAPGGESPPQEPSDQDST